MTTPVYRGATQPPSSEVKGLLLRIGAYLGGSGTPAYAGTGQPAAASSGGLLGSATPAYTAPVTAPDAEAEAAGAETCPVEQSTGHSDARTCPIDGEALAAGHIAIVIPRGG